MSGRRRWPQPPLRTARQCFIAGLLLLFAALVIQFFSINCTDIEGIQHCVVTTYFGMSARTFGMVLGALAIIAFGSGALFYRSHKQTLEAQQNVSIPPALQSDDIFAPPHPGGFIVKPNAQATQSDGMSPVPPSHQHSDMNGPMPPEQPHDQP